MWDSGHESHFEGQFILENQLIYEGVDANKASSVDNTFRFNICIKVNPLFSRWRHLFLKEKTQMYNFSFVSK